MNPMVLRMYRAVVLVDAPVTDAVPEIDPDDIQIPFIESDLLVLMQEIYKKITVSYDANRETALIPEGLLNDSTKQVLECRTQDLGVKGAEYLANIFLNGALPQLHKLNLGSNQIGDAGITALAQVIKPVSEDGSGALAKCQTLTLNSNQIGDDGIEALASACASGALAQLKELYLYENQIGYPGVSALASACASGALAQCRELGLGGNQIGDVGCSALADACSRGALAKLEKLVLYQNQIGDAGLTALAASGALAKCQELYLSGNKIGDPGLASLADVCARGALPQLRDLYLSKDAPALEAACQARGITFH